MPKMTYFRYMINKDYLKSPNLNLEVENRAQTGKALRDYIAAGKRVKDSFRQIIINALYKKIHIFIILGIFMITAP